VNQFLAAYFIQGVTLILVSLRLDNSNIESVGASFPFLKGSFQVFSKEWYRFIGSQLAFTLFMSMWYNHFGKFVIECWYALLRWHDRGFKCKRDDKP
jgi:hypothetical protein